MVPGKFCPPMLWSFIVGGYMELYLIAGCARSGKNQFASYLKEEWERRGKKVCLLKITSPLYHYACDYFGWDGDEKKKPRTFLQTMGIEYIKEELKMPDFLLNRLKEDVLILSKFFDIGIITDGRLKEEIQKLKEQYPSLITIHILRSSYDSDLTEKEKSHITEQNLIGYHAFDEEILNDSLENLHQHAQKIVAERSVKG